MSPVVGIEDVEYECDESGLAVEEFRGGMRQEPGGERFHDAEEDKQGIERFRQS